MPVMMKYHNGKGLSGHVGIDDASRGGELPGKRGRGSRNRASFVVTVGTTQVGRPWMINQSRVHGFRLTGIIRHIQVVLATGNTVFFDEPRCFRATGESGCKPLAIVSGGERKSMQHLMFKWLNIVPYKVGNGLPGTFHAICGKYVPRSRYLAEFEYQLKRRFSLFSMIKRLLFISVASLRIPSTHHHLLKMIEVCG